MLYSRAADHPSGFRRVSYADRCPVCGHESWCLVAGSQDSPTAAICPRTAAGSTRYIDDSGHLHRLRDDPDWRSPRVIEFPCAPVDQHPWLAPLAEQYTANIPPACRYALPLELGVSAEALERLGYGWDPRPVCYVTGMMGAWTFPMFGADGRVCGISLRMLAGAKRCLPGSHLGLFVPRELFSTPPRRLFIAEGASDTATLLDFGLAAVGRTSCTSCVSLLMHLVLRLRPADVVIVADGDSPGQRGALRLASSLAAYVPTRIICPPLGVKDIRQYRLSGGTPAGVLAAVNAAALYVPP